jgi:hypothetical protein
MVLTGKIIPLLVYLKNCFLILRRALMPGDTAGL